MELEPAGSDSDSDDGFYEACLAASRRLVTRKAPAPTPPAPTPPPKTAGGKRKLGDLPTGIRMHQKTQFRITVRDVVTSKKTSRTYKTLEEAEAAYAAERALQAEHKRQKAARPQAEIRAENLARHGNNSKLERDFATALHAADSKIETMNDSVLADSCGFFYDAEPQLALGIQLKVAEKPEKSNGSLWVFGNVNHYPRMPVVCWRADKQDGWIYDGTDLVERKRECLGVTPGGINDALAINTDDERTRRRFRSTASSRASASSRPIASASRRTPRHSCRGNLVARRRTSSSRSASACTSRNCATRAPPSQRHRTARTTSSAATASRDASLRRGACERAATVGAYTWQRAQARSTAHRSGGRTRPASSTKSLSTSPT